MNKEEISRRDFLGQGAMAVGAAGLAARGAFLPGQERPDPSKILNYNKDMDYRRLGKTGLWVSAVCLGGHWKKMDKIVPGVFKKGGGWMEVEPTKIAEFDKNRYEVVSRCIEAGMNDRKFLEDLFSGQQIVTINIIWLPDGSTETRVVLAARGAKRLSKKRIQALTEIAKKVRKMDLRVEYAY